jgi:RNA polymerase sigma-70 factor (ECF subfamily)
VNRARTTGSAEARLIPVAEPGPAVDRGRFDQTGRWSAPPAHWADEADDRIHAAMLAERIRSALDELPSRQRQVVILRDVEGLGSEEVSSMLAITEGNQRVLLHRGRSRLRQVLESHYDRPSA